MELHPVDASKTSLGTPMLHVVPSAQSTRTARLTRHARDFTVWTLALDSAAPTPSAG